MVICRFQQFAECVKKWLLSINECTSVSGVRQTETHTAESAVSEPRASKAELAIEKLKRYKLPSIVEVPSELN